MRQVSFKASEEGSKLERHKKTWPVLPLYTAEDCITETILPRRGASIFD